MKAGGVETSAELGVVLRGSEKVRVIWPPFPQLAPGRPESKLPFRPRASRGSVRHLLLLPVQLLLQLDHPLQPLPQLLAPLLLLPLLRASHLRSRRPSRSHRPSQLGAGTLSLSVLFVSFPNFISWFL